MSISHSPGLPAILAPPEFAFHFISSSLLGASGRWTVGRSSGWCAYLTTPQLSFNLTFALTALRVADAGIPMPTTLRLDLTLRK